MQSSTLTLDAALALLDGYQEEQFFVAEDRFKRARARKKHELSQLRLQARGLEDTLRVLKQQRLRSHAHEQLQLVWRDAAMRQLQERHEAETLNAQLREMVNATLRQSRRLRAMLAFPDGLAPLVHHKRLLPHPTVTNIASVVELHGLLIAVDMVEMQVDETLARAANSNTTTQQDSRNTAGGCRLVVEAFSSSVVPYDMSTASESVWRKLAFDSNASPTDDTNSSTVSRVFTLEVATNNGFRLTYSGSAVYRRRVRSDGRVVVAWASEWEPAGLQDWSDISHESLHRQGFVSLSPSHVDATRFSCVHTYERVERDACGDSLCERGACGDETVAKAERAIAGCVESEMKRTLQSMENELMVQRRSEATVAITALDPAVLAV